MLNGVTLPQKDQVGVLLNPTLLLDKQVWLCPGVHFTIFSWYTIWDLVMVTPALVMSRLKYSNVFRVGLPLEMSQELQLVQNVATCMPVRANRWDHFTSMLQDLHWL